jgi:cytoskeletal protein RodZ
MKSPTVSPASAARKAPPPVRPSSSGNLLALALFVVAVILGGFAWWEHGRAAAAEQRVTELEQKITELERGAQMETPPAMTRNAPLPPPEPMPSEEPPAPPPANQRGIAVANAIGNLLNNPQIQQLAAGMTQGIVTNAYAGFVQQMNMSEEQAAAFNELVAQRAMIGQQVLRDATAQGLDLQANGAQLQVLVRQSEAQVDQQIRGVLGDQGFQQYQDYSRNVQQQFRNGGGLQGFQGFQGGQP